METKLAADHSKPLRRLRPVSFWLFVRYNMARWFGFVALGPIRARRRFRFDGKDYHYFVAAYNDTWANERAVELPIVLDHLRPRDGQDILEIGNVLSHYIGLTHDVVDKYEEAPGVTNIDVLDFSPAKAYDLIVSVSTLEHVGFDEAVRDPEKPARTVNRLRGLLRPGGKLVLTFPLGYNPDLDQQLASGVLELDDVRYLKRVSASNRWQEVSARDVLGAKYGTPYPFANAIAIAVSQQKQETDTPGRELTSCTT